MTSRCPQVDKPAPIRFANLRPDGYNLAGQVDVSPLNLLQFVVWADSRKTTENHVGQKR